jgi:ABC-type uncharacterized transport system substrate-binding protein
VLLALLPVRAVAHPHVWIEATAAFLFERERVVGVQVRWRFDELYSGTLIQDFDGDRDGRFGPEEVAALHSGAFSALQTFSYFTHLRLDGTTQPVETVRDFAAFIDNRRVVYQFVAVLPTPVDPRAKRLAVGPYDPSYYVHFELETAEPVTLGGTARPACRYELFDDAEHPIYFGMIQPRNIRLLCSNA